MRPNRAEGSRQSCLAGTQRPGSQRSGPVKKRNSPSSRRRRNRGGQGNAGACRGGSGGRCKCRGRGGQRCAAGRSVDGKRRGHCVGGSVPGAIKPYARQGATGGDTAVIGLVFHRHIRTALRFNAVPELRNRLPVGEGPSQCPATPSGRARVLNGNCRAESTGVLGRYCVNNIALSESAGRYKG